MPLDNKTITEAIKQAKAKSGQKKFNQTVDLILDIVEIDIPARKLHAQVSDEELAARKMQWRAPEPRFKTGWLARYTKFASNASSGAVLKI